MKIARARRSARVRYKLKRVGEGRMRISLFCSSQHVHAQVIDDRQHKTLAAASTLEKAFKELKCSSSNKRAAAWVGETIAKRMQQNKQCNKSYIIDRGWHRYHAGGKVDAFTNAIRDLGIKV